jgi:hypothetical protein
MTPAAYLQIGFGHPPEADKFVRRFRLLEHFHELAVGRNAERHLAFGGGRQRHQRAVDNAISDVGLAWPN